MMYRFIVFSFGLGKVLNLLDLIIFRTTGFSKIKFAYLLHVLRFQLMLLIRRVNSHVRHYRTPQTKGL